MTQAGAKLGIAGKLSEALSDVIFIFWIDDAGGIAHDFGQSTARAANHRAATCHRFHWRKSEALEVGGIDHGNSRLIQGRQLLFRNKPEKLDIGRVWTLRCSLSDNIGSVPVTSTEYKRRRCS